MTIIGIKQVDVRATDAVFRQSRIGAIVLLLLGVGLGVGGTALFLHPPRNDATSRFFSSIMILMGLGLTLGALGMWRANRRPSNWLMRITAAGDVYIKFRSYLNWQFDENEPQVIWLRRGEIATAGVMRVKRVTPGHPGNGGHKVDLTELRKYLQITLRNAPGPELAESLRRERLHPPQGNRTLKSKWQDSPVGFDPPLTLRVAFLNSSAAVRPGVKKAVKLLAATATPSTGGIAVVPDTKTDEDYRVATLRPLQPDEQRRRLSRLAASDHMAATRTAKEVLGLSTTDAVAYIRELRQGD